MKKQHYDHERHAEGVSYGEAYFFLLQLQGVNPFP
jgi:hypothetical protein